MPDDISDLLFDAWRRVRETLRNKPHEVAKRLRRGRETWLKAPAAHLVSRHPRRRHAHHPDDRAL